MGARTTDEKSTITYNTGINPLDLVENVLDEKKWVFDRIHDTELALGVKGRACRYHIDFQLQDDQHMLRLECRYELTIPEGHYTKASATVMKMNEGLSIGYFHIDPRTFTPSFRHTCLLRGVGKEAGTAHIATLMDFALAQCERQHATFALLSEETNVSKKTLAFALMDVVGRA